MYSVSLCEASEIRFPMSRHMLMVMLPAYMNKNCQMVILHDSQSMLKPFKYAAGTFSDLLIILSDIHMNLIAGAQPVLYRKISKFCDSF